MGAFKELCIETIVDENPEDLRVIGLIELLAASKSLDNVDQPQQLHLIPDISESVSQHST